MPEYANPATHKSNLLYLFLQREMRQQLLHNVRTGLVYHIQQAHRHALNTHHTPCSYTGGPTSLTNQPPHNQALNTHTHTHTLSHARTHAGMQACTHARTHTHTHTHTLFPVQIQKREISYKPLSTARLPVCVERTTAIHHLTT